MGKLTVASIVTLFIVTVTPESRHPRFVRGTYTNTVTDTRVLTSLVPSSCIYVDATLPPCRNVRYLRFPNFLPNNWYSSSDEDPKGIDRSDAHQTQTTTLGWGEYLGLYAPTVTVTTTEIRTSTVEDPRVVVTFAVKGCKPVKIPGGLDACVQDTSSIEIEEILPTSTVLTHPVSTVIDPHDVSTPKNARFIDLAAAKAYEDKRKGEGIEGSTYELEEDLGTVKPTEKLPF